MTVTPGKTATTSLRLPRAATVTGRVFQPDGKPLANGDLFIVGAYWDETLTLKTDADGNYALTEYAPQTGVIHFIAPGVGAGGTRKFWVGAGMTARGTDVRLRRFGAMSGVVRDAKTGAPVAGITVAARWAEDAYVDVGVTLTDADGRFTLRGLDAGDYALRVQPLDAPPTDRVPSIKLKAGERKTNQTLAVTISHGRTLFGRALDTNGQPLAGASLRVTVRPHGVDLHGHPVSGGAGVIVNRSYAVVVINLPPPLAGGAGGGGRECRQLRNFW